MWSADALQPPVIRALLVFGDSLSDGGNARLLLGDRAFPSPPHWANRRCDGPLWVEHLAAQLGLPPLRPSLDGGSNHAFGGARSGAGLSPKGAPNLLSQVEGWAEAGGTGRAAAEAGDWAAGAVGVLRAGANDYLDAPPSPAIGDAVNRHLLSAVEALAERGLRRFLLPSELPWGCSPIDLPGVGMAERQALNRLIERQNHRLRQALRELAARRGLLVWQPDFHGLFLQVQARPEAWGFREVGRPVLGAGVEAVGGLLAGPEGAREGSGQLAVPGAEGFLWWDAWGHLTSAFHALLAKRAVSVVKGQPTGEEP